MTPIIDTPMARRAALGKSAPVLQFCQCPCGGEFYVHFGSDFYPIFCPYCGSKWVSSKVSSDEMRRQLDMEDGE